MTINSVYPKLLAARAKFSPVVKSSENDFFNSKYATLGDLLGAVEPALTEQGLVITHTFETTEAGKIECVTSLIDTDSGNKVDSTWLLTPVKNDPQGLGSAATYCRRYSLLGLLSIAPEDDDGNAASKRFEEPKVDWAAMIASAKVTTAATAKAIATACWVDGQFNGAVKDQMKARIAELEEAEAAKAQPAEGDTASAES